jgi:hypothetical protein
MPTYNIILPAIDVDETARYAGLQSQQNFPVQLIKDACLEGKLLSTPKAVWEIYQYDSQTHQINSPIPLQLGGDSIISHLAGCEKIVVLAVTIGTALETKAAQLFSHGNYTAGLLLDAAGSTAVEAAADKVNEYIAAQAERDGLTSLTRFSPGYGDWPISVQPAIINLAGGIAAGIETTSSCMLIPRKSITAVIGLKAAGVASVANGRCIGKSCQNCPQKNCIARKES